MSDKIKVNLDAKAENVQGDELFLQSPGKPDKQATWAAMASVAVAGRYQGEENMDFDKTLERGRLAKKLRKGGEIELKTEQFEEIKKLFAKRWGPDYVAGFAEAMGITE